MPSAGIRDVLVVSLKEEKQVRFHSTYTASHEVIYLHLAIQNLNDRTMMKASHRVEEFYSILEQVHSKDCPCGLKKDICQGLHVFLCSLCLHACR